MGITTLDYGNLFAIAPTPLMVLDTELRFVMANDCYLAVTARRLDDLVGNHVFDVFPEKPERMTKVRGFFERALAGEANSQDPHAFAIARPDGGFEEVWWTTEQRPLHDSGGDITGLLQHCRDVTGQIKAERMQAVISQEYDHRVRNMLAKVSAVARRTANSAASLQQFIDDFDPRIAAMARAHDLLVNGGWEQLSLAGLIASELQPYVDSTDGRVAIAGPAITLSSHVGQALGMALHELVTNATKYGALSRADGHLDVRWSISEGDGALRLVWIETGVPITSSPRRLGFGSTIIDRVLPAETGGTVDRRFTEQGMACTIDIPPPRKT